MKSVIAALRKAQAQGRSRMGGYYWVCSGAWLPVKNWEVIHNYVASWKKGDPRWN